MDTEILQAVSSILSVVIAAVALFTAIRSEGRANKQFQENIRLQKEADERAQKQFEDNLRLQNEVIQLENKPVLTLGSNYSWNERGITLTNVGNGTAVVKRITYRLGEQEDYNIVNLIQFPEGRTGIYSVLFGTRPNQDNYLEAGTTTTLFLVSRAMYEDIREQMAKMDDEVIKQIVPVSDDQPIVIDDALIQDVLATVTEQLQALSITIEYEDILGNQQATLRHTPINTT
ncbi:MAG: hypothetical protein AAF846_16105 [Chloroflexota bacterium]